MSEEVTECLKKGDTLLDGDPGNRHGGVAGELGLMGSLRDKKHVDS